MKISWKPGEYFNEVVCTESGWRVRAYVETGEEALPCRPENGELWAVQRPDRSYVEKGNRYYWRDFGSAVAVAQHFIEKETNQ